MKFIYNLKNITQDKPCALTIGNFDGVHLGHDKIINNLIEIAREKKINANLMSFYPHPLAVFKPEKFQNFLINSLAQKLKIFKNYSLNNVFIMPFTPNFAALSANDFVEEILVKRLKVKHLVIGYDFIFGKNREGNLQFLQKKAQESGFEITNFEALKNGDEIYSSSLAREFIREGNVKKAQEILGHNFAVEGIVVNGKKIGREIGFKTANIKAKPHIIKPCFGVYKSEVFIPFLNKKFQSITNFGIKPTLENQACAMFETHIFNFDQEIYGKKIIVELLDFVRPEKKFSSIDELKAQIKKDIN